MALVFESYTPIFPLKNKQIFLMEVRDGGTYISATRWPQFSIYLKSKDQFLIPTGRIFVTPQCAKSRAILRAVLERFRDKYRRGNRSNGFTLNVQLDEVRTFIESIDLQDLAEASAA